MAIENEITLSNQEQGESWKFRVLAINKASEGTPTSPIFPFPSELA